MQGAAARGGESEHRRAPRLGGTWRASPALAARGAAMAESLPTLEPLAGGVEEGVPPTERQADSEPEPGPDDSPSPMTPSRFRVSESVAPLGDEGPTILTPRPASVAEEETTEGSRIKNDPPAPVRMASTVSTALTPTTVLVHGLDSSKDTWVPILQDLCKAGYPAIALDQRGHGETPLGPPEDFRPDALANDIFAAAAAHGIDRPFVLVGHSMGGRVCMRAAAIDAERVERGLPPLLAAFVIEDIDVSPRSGPTPPDSELSPEQQAQLRRWEQDDGRRFDTVESCEEALLPWYENDKRRVRSMSHTNASTKIRPCKDGRGFWSDFNPAAKRLAQRSVLHTSDASEAWKTLAAQAIREGQDGGGVHCPIEMWISAPKGTVCSWEGDGGLNEMIAAFDAAPAGSLSHQVFSGSTHCIHRSRRKDYVAELKRVIDACTQRGGLQQTSQPAHDVAASKAHTEDEAQLSEDAVA
eukprot:COSAG02_NODE_5394_length_4367_cov_2.073805_3_plen_470_part_00